MVERLPEKNRLTILVAMPPSKDGDNALQIKEKSTENCSVFIMLKITARSASDI